MYFLKMLILLFTLGNFIAVYGSEPEIQVEISPVSCHAKSDGSLMIHLKNISSPVSLRIVHQITKDTAYRHIQADAEIELKNLSGGVINLDLLAESGIVTGTHALILEPEPLSGGKIIVEKAPSNETACDGILAVEASGGNPPYTYLWSENTGSRTEARISNMCMGIYRCEVNDSNECGPVFVSVPLIKNVLNKNIE